MSLTPKQLNRLMRQPGRLLEVDAKGWGAVLQYKGPVPCPAEEPSRSDFEQVAAAEPAALAAWFCLRELPRRSAPNGPFPSTWHLRGTDTWTALPGLVATADGWFLVDKAARTITYRPSGKTMTEAEVFAALANPPRDLAAAGYFRTAAHHLMVHLPDEAGSDSG